MDRLQERKCQGLLISREGVNAAAGRGESQPHFPGCGDFSLMRRKLSLTVSFWGVVRNFIYLTDQARVHSFCYLSHFPTAPGLLKSCLRASSQGIARVISQTVQFTRPRVLSPEKRRGPVCCTQRHGQGAGKLGKECGTHGLPAPPPHISAGHSGGRSATRTERFCPRPLS